MKKISMGLAIVLALILAFLGFHGAFMSVELEEKMTGPYYLIYQQHTGDYSKMGPIMSEMYEDFLAHNWKFGSGVEIFYDDPQNVDTDKLKSDIGIIVKSSAFDKSGELSGQYLTQILPQANRLVINFPYKTKLSFIVGVFKAYPEINKYLKENNYNYDVARLEIYDKKSIQYLVELSVKDF